MWLVQTTVNISGQRVNDRDVCRTTAEGKKTFLAKRYGVCRGFKTFWDGPCVCDAKINCVNYCKDVLEQGLLSAIRRISNNDFVVQQDTAPAHHSHHTVAYLCYSFFAPEFTEPENWPLNTQDLYLADYSVLSVAADGVSSQNFRYWSAEASSDRLMGSGKPGYTKSSDRL